MRELKDWLTSYLEYTDNTEPPISYHTWCGLSVLSGAIQRKVYLKWGLGEFIYPNLYTVLVGPSGRTRKGTAIGVAKRILRQIGSVSITPESSSGKQAMILAMKRANSNFQDINDGKVKNHSSLTTFSEELSVFLGQSDISYLAALTDWYDCSDNWEYETVGRGRESVPGVCLTLLGATAPEWIQSMLPYEAIGGGFTSRVIFIVEERKRKIVPEFTITEKEELLGDTLVRDLDKIAKISGEFHMDASCKRDYVDWYIEQDRQTERGNYAVPDTRFSNYCERRATHLRKLTILSCISRGDSLIADVEDFNRARTLLESAEQSMAKTFGGLGKGRNSDATETIKTYIEKVGITTRKLVLQRFYRDVDGRTLSEIEETLRQMGCIKIKLLIQEQDKSYEWIQSS